MKKRIFAALTAILLPVMPGLAQAAGKPQRYRNQAAGVSFLAPEDWKKMGDHQAMGDLVAFADVGVGMLKLSADTPKEHETLDQAADVLMKEFEALKDYKLIKRESVAVGKVPAILCQFSAKSSFAALNWALFFRKDPKANILTLSMSSSSANAKANEGLFRKAMSSLKFDP